MNQVQLFIKQLTSDERFRRFALANPTVALGAYDLTAPERQSLTRLCGRLSGAGVPIVKPNSYWQ